jgi:hypothetical protein
MNEFKIRASAAGKLMTNPKNKSEVGLSETTKTYCKEWMKSQIYGFEKEISSKYLEKGIQLEDTAIDRAIEWLDLPFVLKNEELFENEYAKGTPDILYSDTVIDIKCSWDAFTFPLFEDEIPNMDYYYQLQTYMWLTGKKTAKLAYLLLNTPEHIASWETKRDYDGLDKQYRIKCYTFDFDLEVIEKLKTRVELCREYINQLSK